MPTRPVRFAGCLFLACAAVGFPAAVHACSVTTTLSLGTVQGPPQSTTRVFGAGFGGGPVQVRWGSMGGPLLADPVGTSFGVVVTIPDVAPGVYYIDAADGVGPVDHVSAVFRVTAPVATAPSGGPPAAASVPAPAGQRGAPTAAPAANQPASASGRAAQPGPATGRSLGAGSTAAGPIAGAVGSAQLGAAADAGAAAANPAPAPAQAVAPAASSGGSSLVFGDIASGFTRNTSGMLRGASPAAVAGAGGSGSPLLPLGAAAGAAALAAAAARTAALRRRSQRVSRSTR